MRRRQPDVKRNDAGLNPESQKEQNKRGQLLSAVEMGCDRTEAGEFGAAAGVNQQRETKQQAPGVNVRHDDVEQSRSPSLPVFVVEGHQPVSSKRHYFPCNQKQKGIRRSKNNRHAEKQQME